MAVSDADIAVIGMSGRFPEAPDLAAFWVNLRAGRDCVSFFDEAELLAAGIPTEALRDPSHVAAQGILADAECFDPQFFDLSPADAALLDPQQRLFLMEAVKALEDAGIDPDRTSARIGVLAGASMNSYYTAHVLPSLAGARTGALFQAMVANDKDFLATRVAYKLDLKGCAYTVQTACSTSLVAIHMACQALIGGECEIALAGGSTLKVPQVAGYRYDAGQIFSPRGRIRAFDAQADGIVLGNGVGVVVLKPLAAALANKDRIHAVIKGSATNNDGAAKASYSAPSRDGQARVIAEALAVAGVPARSIGYVEAHGTGTQLGDPVEIAGLTRAFRGSGAERGYCGIGSVKSAIGHLDAAAGVAGLIKAVLMLKHRELVPSIHYRQPNPEIDFPATPFYVVDSLRPWPAGESPRRAGVSSFGIGGTNAHAVLEEAPEAVPGGATRPVQPLLVSAKSAPALERLWEQVARALAAAQTPEARADIAYTLAVGRRLHAHRRFALIDPRAADPLSGSAGTSATLDFKSRPVALHFAHSEGPPDPQLLGEPAYAQAHADGVAALGGAGDARAQGFAALVALGRLCRAWGIAPDAVSGTGIGVLAAAVAADALPLESAATLLAGGSADGTDLRAPGAATAIALLDAPGGAPLALPSDRAGWQALIAVPPPDAPASGAPDGDRLLLHLAPGLDRRGLLDALGRLWLAGVALRWDAVFAGEDRRRTDAPTYPFEHRRCWIEPEPGVAPGAGKSADPCPAACAPPDLLLLGRTWHPRGAAPEAAPEAAADRECILVLSVGLEPARWAPGHAGATPIALPADDSPGGFERAAAMLLKLLKAAAERERPTLLQIVVPEGCALADGLAAMLRSACLEVPRVKAQVVEVPPHAAGPEALAPAATLAGASVDGHHLRWTGQGLLAAGWSELDCPSAATPWQAGETYLITGGLGGLGRLFAAEILRVEPAARVLLIGRSQPDAAALAALGPGASYRRADVADPRALKRALAGVRLKGVLHAAGTVADRLIASKSAAELAATLRPKVAGLAALDAATAKMPLDFFVAFSSAVAGVGNPGQVDYAAANGWLEAFMARRAGAGDRPGRSLAIAWPIWRDGGMQVPAATVAAMAHATGMAPLPTRTGLRAFYAALAAQPPLVLAMTGDLARARARFLGAPTAPAAPEPAPGVAPETLAAGLKVLFADLVGWDPETVDDHAPFAAYGIDSVATASLNLKLAEIFPRAPRTLLFEHRTVAELAGYLSAACAAACAAAAAAWLAPARSAAPAAVPAPATAAASEPPAHGGRTPVAIVGLRVRFPGAPDTESFWRRLWAGERTIGDLPAGRWPLPGFYEPDRAQAVETGRSYLKQGGFLEDWASFDAAFFNIAPRDALAMDPQERLFLETCWQALEDAGIAPSRLGEAERAAAGVYGGITKTGYALWSAAPGAGLFGTSFSSMVNRVSHALDLRGPSLPVDAMCASSPVALLEACKALRSGAIDLALAGAVNLYLHPQSYALLCQTGMAAGCVRDGAFAKGGDGFVPSEGVGVAVLKRLDDALRDGDDVLAVIRGGAANHSGRTNGYYAPDLRRQAAVIEAALADAGLAPEEIDYLELAASGAETADAVELAALARVFGRERRGRRMGTLKPLIGHGEAVAGMAQLAKAVLQLRAGALAPTPLAAETRPDLDLRSLPFALQDAAEPWARGERPRRIGIDGFGAGGVNAHLILEECTDSPPEPRSGPALFVLSARTEAALRDYLRRWRAFLAAHPDLDLGRAARTLQIGREPMRWRFACVAADREALIAALDTARPVDSERDRRDLPAPAALTEMAESGALEALAAAWQRGAAPPWDALYRDAPPRRLCGLPVYPFQGRPYWPAPAPRPAAVAERPAPAADAPRAGTDPAAIRRGVEHALRRALGTPPDAAIDPAAPFWTLGLSSVLVVRFTDALSSAFGLDLGETVAFEHGCLDALATHIAERLARSAAPDTPVPAPQDELDALLAGVLDGSLAVADAAARLQRR